ncbi:MAG: deoxyribodipyrimidine photo-lyase [Bacteroidia bacterium]|nr:deoxyribodipyrimidine photo-lyase [Bacteroidia bacterium]
MQNPSALTFFWFRRDLRLEDNHGLFQALKSGNPVQPLFILDSNILSQLEDPRDRRVEFIYQHLQKLDAELRKLGSGLWVEHGSPQEVWSRLTKELPIAKVFTNHDYEPYAQTRDAEIGNLLGSKEIEFRTFKDQVIFEKSEVVKDDGLPYTVFTPYSRKWKARLQEDPIQFYSTLSLTGNFRQGEVPPMPSLESIGFAPSGAVFPGESLDRDLVRNYAAQRDIPSIRGTSRLSVHLRFGTVSIRKLVLEARSLSESWLNELIWREFYQMILWHFPHVVNGAFRSKYDHIKWRHDEGEFLRWCEGRTGYPLVDAGMRELNATGFMHNRVRMVTASFLTKHLLIDWRWGEAYFAEKLLDFDLASNNGGWQWAAGTGCDAAPYFRIFNPESQMKKFDPKGKYVRHWVPEFGTPAYPRPVVEHSFARERCLAVFKEGLEG